jgi:hypothetical protein
MAQPAFTMVLENKKFNSHVQRLIDKYPDKVNAILKKFAFDLIRKIIFSNPRDTGRCQAGWYVSAQKLGVQHEFGSSAEVEEGKGLSGYHEVLTGSKRYIEMINGVKYAIFLEYGSSRQAPYGMVRVSFREITGDKMPAEMGSELQREWKRFY